MPKSKEESIPIELIRTAVAVARCGSLSGAARRLGIGKGTAKLRVDALEELVGFKVFEVRDAPKPMSLTPRGAELLRFCLPFDQAYAGMLERFLRRREDKSTAAFQVAATPTPYVPDAVLAAKPDRALAGSIRERDTASVLRAVACGKAQVGIVEAFGTSAPIVEGTCDMLGLRCRAVHTTRCHALMRLENPALAQPFRKVMPESMLAGYIQAVFREPSLPEGARLFNQLGEPSRALVVDDRATMAQALLSRDVYALGSGYFHESLSNRLVAVPTAPERPVSIYWVTTAGATQTKAQAALEARLRKRIAQMRDARDASFALWHRKRKGL